MFSASGKSQHFAEDCSILYMKRGMWFGRDVKRTDICRRDETVTVGTQFLRNTALVHWRHWILLGLIVYWIAWFYLKFCWSSSLVYITLIRNTILCVCVCVYETFNFEIICWVSRKWGNILPFSATPTQNIKFPTRSCVNLSCCSFVYNPEIVYINGSLKNRNVFRCDRFREYDKLWGCVTSLFIYSEVGMWHFVHIQIVTHDWALCVMFVKNNKIVSIHNMKRYGGVGIRTGAMEHRHYMSKSGHRKVCLK